MKEIRNLYWTIPLAIGLFLGATKAEARAIPNGISYSVLKPVCEFRRISEKDSKIKKHIDTIENIPDQLQDRVNDFNYRVIFVDGLIGDQPEFKNERKEIKEIYNALDGASYPYFDPEKIIIRKDANLETVLNQYSHLVYDSISWSRLEIFDMKDKFYESFYKDFNKLPDDQKYVEEYIPWIIQNYYHPDEDIREKFILDFSEAVKLWKQVEDFEIKEKLDFGDFKGAVKGNLTILKEKALRNVDIKIPSIFKKKEPKKRPNLWRDLFRESMYDKIKGFGSNWKGSKCSGYSNEQFIEEMGKKATFDKVKLYADYTDGVSKDSPNIERLVDFIEKIPDQLQAKVKNNGVSIILCDKSNPGSPFHNENPKAIGYYFHKDRHIYLSVPDCNSNESVHEFAHAFDDAFDDEAQGLDTYDLFKDYFIFKTLYEKDKPILEKNYPEYFAFLFENYYGSESQKQSFKSKFPEEFEFFRKYEALMIEKSLNENWLEK